MVAPPRSAPPAIFGFVPAAVDAETAAARVLDRPPPRAEGASLVVTPNIQHVALMAEDPAFAEAVRSADLLLCDGFPVLAYARLRGHRLPARATGREVVAHLMDRPAALRSHRMLAVVDTEATAAALRGWAHRHALGDRVEAVAAPPGLRNDAVAQRALVDTIRGFAPTILLFCLGAPTSELFLHHHRRALPACWALCVGQSVKLALGLVAPPPRLAVALRLEWAWRIMLEPRRLFGRYLSAGWGFGRAVLRDRRSS